MTVALEGFKTRVAKRCFRVMRCVTGWKLKEFLMMGTECEESGGIVVLMKGGFDEEVRLMLLLFLCTIFYLLLMSLLMSLLFEMGRMVTEIIEAWRRGGIYLTY